MDFKDWEKILEKPDVIIMRHRKGHTMNIAVNALPKIQREQLKRLELAKGGQVSNDHLDSGDEDGVSAQGQAVRSIHKSKEKEDNENMDEEKEYAREEAKGRADFEKKFVKPKIKGFVLGGNVSQDETAKPEEQQPDQSQEAPQSPTSGNHAPITIINNTGPQPQAAQAQQPPPAPVSNLQPQQSPYENKKIEQLPNLLSSDNTVNLPETLKLQQQGIQEHQQAEANKSQSLVQNEDEYIKERKRIADLDAENYKELKSHTDDFANYMKSNPINPKAYQESMSSGQKVAGAIGLFLGGFGTPFGGQNYAMDFLNKQIDRDIDAQKSRASNANTVWGAYEHLYGDSKIATNLAKVSALENLTHKVNLAAANTGTAQAQAAAKLMAAENAFKANQILIDTSGRLGTLRMGGVNKSVKKQGDNGQDESMNDHVLTPNADKIGLGLQFNPLAKPNLQGIEDQKAKADLSDKAIDTINEKFNKLASHTGSTAGYLRRKGHMLGNIPIAGKAIEGVTNLLTDIGPVGEVNRSYDSDYSAIVGAVRGALQGNVSEDLLDKTVRDNTPEAGDTPELLKQKQKNLKEFIISHTKSDLLRPLGLSNK